MRVIVAFAALVAIALLPEAAAQRPDAYRVELLHPDVQAAVIEARNAESRGHEAAVRAREAAQLGDDAAARARSGESGYRVFDYENDAESRRYEGAWSEDARQDGFGALLFGPGPFEGDRFSGQWERGRKILGVYAYAPAPSDVVNSRYEGEYDGSRSGYGVYHGRSGAVFAGSVDRRGYSGSGVHRFADGRRYEGQFRNNMPHGFGVMWTADGRVRRSGVWTEARLTRRLSPERRR